jgi:acyl-CoA synthetase (AMP-forming)/AMP-acid ligase II
MVRPSLKHNQGGWLMRLIDFFDLGARRDPAAPCFVHDGTERVYSFGHVRELTVRAVNGLRADGFAAGMKGAVLSPNDAMAFACLLSIVRAGMVWVTVNPKNALEENCYILASFECEVLFYHSVFESAIAEIRRRVPRIRRFVCIDQAGAQAPALMDWVRDQPTTEVDPGTGPEDIAILQATGGTTGVPKGAMLTNRCLEACFANLFAILHFDERPPVYLAAAPLTHAGGIVALFALALGGQVVLQPKVDPQLIASAIEKHRVSLMFLPPTAIYALLASPAMKGRDFSSLKYFIYGAAPMAPEKLRDCIKLFGPVMCQMFGQTETIFPIAYLSPRDHLTADGQPAADARLTSCGRTAPFSRLAIMDDTGTLLGDGEVGEIVVRGTSVMAGYFKNSEETARASAFGWHHTGDIGYRDEQGFYFIVDRKKDMIVTGGLNVWSVEVEKVILSHQSVMDCAVVGVPDDKWGEAIMAVVELKPGMSVTADDIVSLCKSQLGSVKAPKSVEFVSALPRSAVGKVLKRELRDRFWQGHSRRVG